MDRSRKRDKILLLVDVSIKRKSSLFPIVVVNDIAVKNITVKNIIYYIYYTLPPSKMKVSLCLF